MSLLGRLPRRHRAAVRMVVAAVVGCSLVLVFAPAEAAPPTERSIEDAREKRKALDILRVEMSAAPKPGGKAKVAVFHSRKVAPGDGFDAWIDTDGDREPDLLVTGYAFSEYAVFKTRGFDGRGRDISDRGCASLRMVARRAVVRFAPDCLGESRTFAVGVRSHVQGRPARTDDYVPRADKLTRKVLSYAS